VRGRGGRRTLQMAKNSWLAIRNGPAPMSDDQNDDVLVGTLLLYGIRRVANDETFAPLGGVGGADGISTVGVDTGGENAKPSEVLAYLEQTVLKDEVSKGARAVASVADVTTKVLKDEVSKGARAVASVADVTAGAKGRAICVHFEEVDGYVIDVIFPYSKKRWFRAGSLGDRSRMASERRIFSRVASERRIFS
jgi:hypothetical protein